MANDVKPDCYKCRFRADAAGSCHSECNHPKLMECNGVMKSFAMAELLIIGKFRALNVTGSHHGIAKGWFMWPINFDPVWLESCDGFERREVSNDVNDTTKSDSISAVSPTNATNATKAP